MEADFVWDETKAAANISKHRVSFTTAVQAFADPRQVLVDVSRVGDGEKRFKVIGMVDGRLLAVVFTYRAADRRLISARRTNRSEDKDYGDRNLRS